MLYETQGPFRTLIDPQAGTVDRSIYSDEAIYQLELERIFARAWNFMCHESQIQKAGDFFLSYIGEESVIATRDKKGDLQVLLNSCRHRGNAVCRAEEGNARSFLCTYHGWTYGLDGQLIGVPGYKDFYHEQLDKSQWGLVKAKVASYRGFVFATMDHEAPDLEEYLGDVGRMAIDIMAEKGDLVAVGGVQKNIIGCNWKLAVDNLFDFYHAQISHASATMSGFRKQVEKLTEEEREMASTAGVGNGGPRPHHRVVFGAYGHAIGGPRLTPEMRQLRHDLDGKLSMLEIEKFRDNPESAEKLGEVGIDVTGHPNVFPNLWLTNRAQMSLRLPRGPSKCEIWWFTFAPRDATDAVRNEIVEQAIHVFGAGGLLEQDDGENWDQSTRAMKGPIARRYPLNFSMNVGGGQVKRAAGVSYIDSNINEHAQLWTYQSWADWMDAESWAALRQNHTRPPEAESAR
jgi:3-phenylpropionate/trans-cinnamate dioxygenase alpha subunit